MSFIINALFYGIVVLLVLFLIKRIRNGKSPKIVPELIDATFKFNVASQEYTYQSNSSSTLTNVGYAQAESLKLTTNKDELILDLVYYPTRYFDRRENKKVDHYYFEIKKEKKRRKHSSKDIQAQLDMLDQVFGKNYNTLHKISFNDIEELESPLKEELIEVIEACNLGVKEELERRHQAELDKQKDFHEKCGTLLNRVKVPNLSPLALIKIVANGRDSRKKR